MQVWDFLVTFFWIYIILSVLIIIFRIIGDIFTDHTLHGGAKALWLIFIILVPFLGAFVYLIARGRSMTERAIAKQKEYQDDTAKYIRSVASTSSTDDIANAKALLDAGTITQAEFDSLKAKALAA